MWHQEYSIFTDTEHPHRCWTHDWTRDQCVTVAQLRTGHSPLLVAYLHGIGRRDSATCPQWYWWDGRTSGVTLPSTRPGMVGVMAKSPLSKRPKMAMELPGEDRGGDPSPTVIIHASNTHTQHDTSTKNTAGFFQRHDTGPHDIFHSSICHFCDLTIIMPYITLLGLLSASAQCGRTWLQNSLPSAPWQSDVSLL